MSAIMFGTKYDTKWHNAVNDLASINASVDAKTTELNGYMALYDQAMAAITAGGNTATGCNKSALCKTRHISTWRAQRDSSTVNITRCKKELSDLVILQSSIAASQTQSATALQTTAAANLALSKADIVETTAMASKIGTYALIAGIGIAVIIGGIIIYKKLKKK